MTPSPESQNKSRRRWVTIGIGGVVFFCCLCTFAVALTQPTDSEPEPLAQAEVEAGLPGAQEDEPVQIPTATAIPSPTPSAITMAEISQNRSDMTELQWEEYEKTLPGLRVHWTVEVSQVSDDGTLYLEAGQEMFQSVFLEGVPKETAIEVTKGQIIEFEATIRSVTTIMGLTIWLDNPTILSIR